MTAAVALKVERVSKVHPPANALPGLRAHQLQLALHDMAHHRFRAGQHVWVHTPQAVTSLSPSAAPLPLPAPVWLLVQAWAHAAITAGAARLQLAPSATAPNASPVVQQGDMVHVQPLTAPLLPATSLTLRRLVSDAGESTSATLSDSPATPTDSGSGLQPAIDSFIRAALLGRPCHVGMALSVQLFNSTHQLVVEAVEPAAPKADNSTPPAVYTASAETDIAISKHSTVAGPGAQSGEDSQAVDFCQSSTSPLYGCVSLQPRCPLAVCAVQVS